jgi:Fe-S cluster biosynthesis and repair protein YggX
MTKSVHCSKLDKEATGLSRAPYPGDIGQKILETISQEAWDMWLAHQTMLINEYRLSLIEPKTREFLEQEMLKFLFEGGSDTPSQYTEKNN